jgi:hypothetical protein
MTLVRPRQASTLLVLLAVLLLGVWGPLAGPAAAEGTEGGGATWRLEQPAPPPAPLGVQSSSIPIGLGPIGDIEFWAPDRGLLITAGNPPTIPPGVWAYNGVEWHELATVCGASDGRIAWAGPDEFWTISDGRPGQAGESGGAEPPPLQDNTLCHFSAGQVVGSYAHPAFQSDSYQAMHAAGCLNASDCWFAGNQLPEPQFGSFHLHWNGSSIEAEPYPGEGHAVEDMRAFEGHLFESVRVSATDRSGEPGSEPPILHRINPQGVTPTFEPEAQEFIPLYAPGELPTELDFLHLSSSEGALWGAASPSRVRDEAQGGEGPTVIRRAEGSWTQLLGPATHPSAKELFPHEDVQALAAEPGGASAWLALDARADSEAPSPTASALVTRISAEGQLSEAQSLPSAQERAEGIGPKGAGAKLVCPAPNDCWLATTQGWLFHLAPEGERTLPRDTDPAFAGPITNRPADQGLPQVPPDAPPVDDSGLVEAPPNFGTLIAENAEAATQARVAVPLLSGLHTHLVHGTTLELRFHLAAKARVRLIAKRRSRVVASTSSRTFAAGSRKIMLRLDPRRWPTKLDLQTHPLAPLPTVSANSSTIGTVSTGFLVLPHTQLSAAGSLP